MVELYCGVDMRNFDCLLSLSLLFFSKILVYFIIFFFSFCLSFFLSFRSVSLFIIIVVVLVIVIDPINLFHNLK